MARHNGQPGRSGIRIALFGLVVFVVGFFIGSQLPGLSALGFVLVLVGFLMALFGVLREVSDRIGH